MTTLKPRSEKISNWLVTVALSAITFIFLWIFRTQQFTGDSLWYAKDALNGTQMFHPHHLWFTPALHYSYQFLNWCNSGLSILEVGQLFNIGSATLTVGLLHRLLLKHVAQSLAFWACIALIFCNGFWTYSTQIEVYIPALFFALLLVWLVGRPRLSMGQIIASGIALSASIFFHQTNVLLVIPLCFMFGQSAWKSTFYITAFAASLTLGGYIHVLHLEGYPLSLNGFLDFSLKYAVAGQQGWGTFSNWLPVGWFELFASQTGNFIRQSYAHVVFYWLVFTLGVLTVLVFGYRLQKKDSRLKNLTRFSFIWVLTNYIFFLWWLPQEGEFFIATLIPLLILLVVQVNSIQASYQKFLLPTFVFCLIAFNANSFYQRHNTPNQAGLRAQKIAAIADDSTMVLTDFFTEQYLEFFHGVKATNTDNFYRSLYNDNRIDLIKIIRQQPKLVFSESHLSPTFKSNGNNAISHPEAWNSGISRLLESACHFESVMILSEPHWVIERCHDAPLSVDSVFSVLKIHPPQ